MWLILGCGYTGAAVARRLVDAGEVVTVARRHPVAIAGAHAIALDLCDPAAVAAAVSPGAIVVHLAPPGDADGARDGAAAAAIARAGARRLVYVSSTGVYAPGGGAVVDEDWPLEPSSPTGHARLAAERAILAAAAAAGLSAVALRAPGIHGPGRGVAARMRAGTYRLIGDGSAHVSRIHVDDLAAAIVVAGTAATLARAIYNVADRDPCTAAVHADGLAARLGLPPPPRVPSTTVTPEVAAMLLADRRVSAARLEHDLGWTPRYPSWRDAPD